MLPLLLLSVFALDSHSRSFNDPLDDGCALLSDVVFQAVLHEALPGQASLLASHRGEETCDDTAATVTRAFTSAMARLGLPLSWGSRLDAYCRSGDITTCRPAPSTGSMNDSEDIGRFVRRSWRAVQVSVSARLRFGSGVDVSRFSVSGLQRSIDLALAVVDEGQLGLPRKRGRQIARPTLPSASDNSTHHANQ
ncbi:MAG: hypothetical protein AAF660_02735 [Pseudomonadota bacterium]